MGEDSTRTDVTALRTELRQGHGRLLEAVERIETKLFRGNGRPSIMERLSTAELALEQLRAPKDPATKGSSATLKLDAAGLRRLAVGAVWVVGVVAALAALSGQDAVDLLRALGLP